MNLDGLLWIIDPGHGWLRVAKAVHPSAVECSTGFGFEDADFVYLEEDCEAGAFLRSLGLTPADRDVLGRIPFEDYASEAPCRSLPRNRAGVRA